MLTAEETLLPTSPPTEAPQLSMTVTFGVKVQVALPVQEYTCE
jgi:hypothetical protein